MSAGHPYNNMIKYIHRPHLGRLSWTTSECIFLHRRRITSPSWVSPCGCFYDNISSTKEFSLQNLNRIHPSFRPDYDQNKSILRCFQKTNKGQAECGAVFIGTLDWRKWNGHFIHVMRVHRSPSGCGKSGGGRRST